MTTLTLTGCATAPFTVLADPQAYAYYNCKQIAAARIGFVNRQKELQGLMDQAAQATAGALIGTIAYQADYTTATESIKVLDAFAREKNCTQQPGPWRSDSAIR